MITVDVDARRAIAELKATPSQVRRAVAIFLPKAGAYAGGVMRRVIASSTKNAKGQTAASVQAAVQGDAVVVGPQRRTTKWGTFDPIFLDQGTRPHEIKPRFAKALAFPRSGSRAGIRGGVKVSVFRFGGREAVSDLVVAMGVHHPGTEGIHFVDRTARAIEGALPGMLDSEIRRQVKDR